MKAFDTDIVTGIFRGNPAYADRVARIPIADQSLPIVVAEEVLRGRLNTIRQAEAGKAKIGVEQAYQLFEQSLGDLREVRILTYDSRADLLYREWKSNKLRGSSHDLRIAAICVAQSATLITRNRRDFERIPGLSVEFWE
jgi:tRNA(fMet)-specific endonuclease VapC